MKNTKMILAMAACCALACTALAAPGHHHGGPGPGPHHGGPGFHRPPPPPPPRHHHHHYGPGFYYHAPHGYMGWRRGPIHAH